MKNPDYAATLRKMVEAEQQALKKGASRAAAIRAAADRFYKGDIAQEIDRFFRENGGVLRASDLAAYAPQWTQPLHTTYRGYDVYSNPATSRGGFEVLMGANLIEAVDMKAAGASSPAALHAVIEAIKISKADIYKLRRRPGLREGAHRRAAVEGVRDRAARALRPDAGDRLSAGRQPRGQPRDLAAGAGPGLRRSLRRRAAHHVVLDRRSLRQRRRHDADARRPLRQ